MNLPPPALCLAAACGLGLLSLSTSAARAEEPRPAAVVRTFGTAAYLNPIVVVEGNDRRFYRDDGYYRRHRGYHGRRYRTVKRVYIRNGRRVVVERRVLY